MAALHSVQLFGLLRKLFLVLLVFRRPRGAGLGSALPHAVLEPVVHSVGDQKLRVFGPPVVFLHQFDFRLAQRLAVCFVGILLVRRSVTNVAVHHDERRPVFRFEKIFVAAGQHVQIVCVRDVRDVPAVAFESRHHVLAEGPLGGTVQRYAVVVVHPAKI